MKRLALCVVLALAVSAAGCSTWQTIKDNPSQLQLINAAVETGARIGTLSLLKQREADTVLAVRLEEACSVLETATGNLITGEATVPDMAGFWESVDTELDAELQEYIEIGVAVVTGYLHAAIEADGELDVRDLTLLQSTFAGVRQGAHDYLPQTLKGESP